MAYKIRNWDKFQHFKDRRPPWVKLYRDILDDLDWHRLDGDSAKHLVMLWLLASEGDDGELPSLDEIAFRLRITEKQAKTTVSKLSKWVIQDDISVISERYQSDRPETETETEKEVETETELMGCKQPESAAVDELKQVYPKRAGSHRWGDAQNAINARLREGHTLEQILDGARRYAAFCKADGITGTKYVLQAATFVGANREFLSDWTPPKRQLSAIERVLNPERSDDRLVN